MKRPLTPHVLVPCEHSTYAIEVDKPKVTVIRASAHQAVRSDLHEKSGSSLMTGVAFMVIV